MAGPKRWLFVGGFALLSGLSREVSAQQTSAVEQVQAIISGLRTPQEALNVDRHLGHIPGVLLTRTDLHTNNLFMLVEPESADQEQAVRASLRQLGLRLGCWTRAARSDQPFKHLDPARCDEIPAVR